MIIQKKNFRRWFNRLSCTVFVITLASPTIQSDDASIKRRFVVNECGAYSRAALFNIFAVICGT